jgi:hypothetical protein
MSNIYVVAWTGQQGRHCCRRSLQPRFLPSCSSTWRGTCTTRTSTTGMHGNSCTGKPCSAPHVVHHLMQQLLNPRAFYACMHCTRCLALTLTNDGRYGVDTKGSECDDRALVDGMAQPMEVLVAATASIALGSCLGVAALRESISPLAVYGTWTAAVPRKRILLPFPVFLRSA